jgi:hypothetical protein
MPFLSRFVALPTAALALGTGVALAQPVAQTPLNQPVQASGTVTPSNASKCGFLSANAVQVLQINQDFAAVNVVVGGSSGLTLLIQGNNDFSECHTSSNGSINAPGLLNRGTYSFFIGNSSSLPTEYSLTIGEN